MIKELNQIFASTRVVGFISKPASPYLGVCRSEAVVAEAATGDEGEEEEEEEDSSNMIMDLLKLSLVSEPRF